MFQQLPDEIKSYIFKYDSTWKERFSLVMHNVRFLPVLLDIDEDTLRPQCKKTYHLLYKRYLEKQLDLN